MYTLLRQHRLQWLSHVRRISPVANMTHLVFSYKVVFLTVSKSLFSADSKSDCSQTQKVERFSKNRSIKNGRLVDDKQYCMMHSTSNILYS